jgi:tRNA-dihydrouridine synthase B
VLESTGADAIMIGRAAQGRPWIFREIAHFLDTGETLPPPRVAEAKGWLLDHLDDHYGLYGEATGVRSARKHIGWTVQGLPGGAAFRARMNTIENLRAAGRRRRRLVRRTGRAQRAPAGRTGGDADDGATLQ